MFRIFSLLFVFKFFLGIRKKFPAWIFPGKNSLRKIPPTQNVWKYFFSVDR